MKKTAIILLVSLILLFFSFQISFAKAYVEVELRGGGIPTLDYKPMGAGVEITVGYKFRDVFSLSAEASFMGFMQTAAERKVRANYYSIGLLGDLKIINGKIIDIDGLLGILYKKEDFTDNKALKSLSYGYRIITGIQISADLTSKFSVYVNYIDPPIIEKIIDWGTSSGHPMYYGINFNAGINLGLKYRPSEKLTYGLSGGMCMSNTISEYTGKRNYTFYLGFKVNYLF